MDESDFRTNFPEGAAVPPLLLRLLEYQNRTNDFCSGHFELSDHGRESAMAWFDGDQQAASQFTLFGEESDGSSFGFWCYDGRSIETAPIVFLGSEGVDCTVLANTLEEFMSLLAVGADNLGFDAACGEVIGPTVPSPKLVKFREWLSTEFGIVPPEDPGRVIADAKRSHPDLQEWLTAWQQKRFG